MPSTSIIASFSAKPGRLEAGEERGACLAREFAVELGAAVLVETILDSWVYEVLPRLEVMIVTYGVRRVNQGPLRVGNEHRRFGLLAVSELDGLPMPEGYRRSIRGWAKRCGIQ
jgi:hypothetical protein